MADLNAEGVFIQVRINEETSVGSFSDAVTYTASDYDAMKDADVDADKQARIDAYVAFIEAQSQLVTPEPTDEQLLAEKQAHEARIAEIDAKLAE